MFKALLERSMVLLGGMSVIVTGLQAGSLQAPATTSPGPSSHRALLDRYCVSCHNQRTRTADLALDTVDVDRPTREPEVWERVIRKLRVRAMPPAGMPRPDEATYRDLVLSLETAIDQAAAASPNPGRPGLHRLNRAEYANAIRDLLGLELDGRSLLPADDSGFGFDNIGDLLSVSPGLLERYMSAAQTISRLAVGDPTLHVDVARFTLPWLVQLQDERVDEDVPFGSRGGTVVRHYFPLDGEYVIKIRVQRQAEVVGGAVRGLDVANQIDLRLDGDRLQLFTIGGRSAAPSGGRGGGGGAAVTTAGGQSAARDASSDWDFEAHVPLKAGTREVVVTFDKSRWDVEGFGPSRMPVASHGYAVAAGTSVDGRVDMGLDAVQIEGPSGGGTKPTDTVSRQRVFVCQPVSGRDERRCANTILATLARRAYRRPVTAADTARLLKFYDAARGTADFEAGIQAALERILVSPQFLFRMEGDPASVAPGSVYRLSGIELASRLSFFLWSSIPDDELLGLAARGRLGEPAVLEQQVRRMLADPRSQALVSNFFGQWLLLRNVATSKPDPKAFPDFDESLRGAFRQETELFLEEQLRSDHSALELITADYTFLNERLARHYGIPGVYGSHFRRVAYPDDRRAGLLGQGSLLTVLSYSNRTSVVVRGKWLLENLMGTPPPPPPANVPPFPESKGGEPPRSVRERMEQHRKNPVCANCHAKMDPLGFALENFDGIGGWRAVEAKKAVDASGTLPDGTPFNGPAELRAALLRHSDAFVMTMTQKLLTYALGRGLESSDMPAVRTIARAAAARDYRWSSLILGIVRSVPFRMRKSDS